MSCAVKKLRRKQKRHSEQLTPIMHIYLHNGCTDQGIFVREGGKIKCYSPDGEIPMDCIKSLTNEDGLIKYYDKDGKIKTVKR